MRLLRQWKDQKRQRVQEQHLALKGQPISPETWSKRMLVDAMQLLVVEQK